MAKLTRDDFPNPLLFFLIVSTGLVGIGVFIVQIGGNRLLDAPPGYLPVLYHHGLVLLLALGLIFVPLPVGFLAAGHHPPIPARVAVVLSVALMAFFGWQVAPSVVTSFSGELHRESATVVETTQFPFPRTRLMVVERPSGRQESLGLERYEFEGLKKGTMVVLEGRRGVLGFRVRSVTPHR